MILNKCQNCDSRFSLYAKFKATYPVYKNIICENCEEEYQRPFLFRLLIAFIMTLPLTFNIAVPGVLFNRPTDIIYVLIYEILILLILPIITPFELKDSENISIKRRKNALQGFILVVVVILMHYLLAKFITYENPDTVKNETLVYLNEKYGEEFIIDEYDKRGVVWYLSAKTLDKQNEILVIWDKFKKPHIQYDSIQQ